MIAHCSTCGTDKEVFWHKGAPATLTQENTIEEIAIHAESHDAIALDEDFEFEDEQLSLQIISLAAASGHSIVEKQIRSLFGSITCNKCGALLRLSPKDE